MLAIFVNLCKKKQFEIVNIFRNNVTFKLVDAKVKVFIYLLVNFC